MWLLDKVVLRAPRLIMFVCLAFFIVAGAGVMRLSVSSDTRVHFNPDGAPIHKLEAFEAKYGQNNTVLMVIWANGRQVTDPDVLAGIGELTDRAWQLPYSTRVESLTNFAEIVSDADSIAVRDLVPDPAHVSLEEAREIGKTALADPLVRNRLIGADGKAAGLVVSFNLPKEASNEVRDIIAASRALAADFEKTHPGMKVQLTGNIMLMGTFAEAAISDIEFLIPISLLVTAIVMILFVRAIVPSLVILSLLVLSSVATMGLAGWVGHVLNTATVAVPVIIMTVNMAAAVRIATTALGRLGKGDTRIEAIREAVRLNFKAVTLTNSTTLVGFLAMNFADAPTLRQQGDLVSLGILIAYVFTFTWLPATLSLLPLKPAVQRSENMMVGLGHFVNAHYKPLFFLCSIIVVSCGVWIGEIRLDDDFVRNFDDRFAYRRASDFAEEHLTGLNIIEFDLAAPKTASGDGGVYDPAYQRHVATFAKWLRSRPEAVSVFAISDLTKRINKAMNAGSPGDYDTIPDNAELIAQYFLLYELSLPYGTSLNDIVPIGRDASRVTVLLRNTTSSQVRALNTAAEKWLDENTPPEMHAKGISLNVLFANLSGVNIRSMIGSTIISIVIIAFVVGFALRSPRYGVLSIFLNVLPSLVGFGVWGLLFGTIGLAGSVVTAMTIGLVVDDTIYFLLMYQAARKKGMSAEEAINHVFATVGVAMLVITASLAIGFGTLMFSGFEVNRSLGGMTAVVILSNLFIDWLMLPPVMRLLDDKRNKSMA